MRPCCNHLCSPAQPNDNRGPNTPPMPMVPPPVPPGMGMEPPRQQGPPVRHMLLCSSCLHAQNWPIKHVSSQIYICNLYMYEYWTCLSPYLMPDTQKGFYSTGKVRLATFCMSVYYRLNLCMEQALLCKLIFSSCYQKVSKFQSCRLFIIF